MQLQLNYKPLIGIVGVSGLTYGAGKLISFGVGALTGDKSIDTVLDLTLTPSAAFTAGNIAINRNTDNKFGTQDVLKAFLLAGLGYDAGRELMAHEAAYGRLDGILPHLQAAYSYLQEGVANLFERLPEELGTDYAASFIRDHAGGLSANIATIVYGIIKLAHHPKNKKA